MSTGQVERSIIKCMILETAQLTTMGTSYNMEEIMICFSTAFVPRLTKMTNTSAQKTSTLTLRRERALAWLFFYVIQRSTLNASLLRKLSFFLRAYIGKLQFFSYILTWEIQIIMERSLQFHLTIQVGSSCSKLINIKIRTTSLGKIK